MGFEEKFRNILEKHPDWSSLVCFKTTLMKHKLKSRSLLKRKFLQLVDPSDYDPKDRQQVRELLQDLYNT